MKKIYYMVVVSICLLQISCVQAGTTNFSRWKMILSHKGNGSSDVELIEKIILKNNFRKSSGGSRDVKLYIHLKYESQTICVFTNTNHIVVDAILFKPAMFQSYDSKVALGEIIEMLKESYGCNALEIEKEDNVHPKQVAK